MNQPVMICKLQLHHVGPKDAVSAQDKDMKPMNGTQVRFGAVWEGSAENQAKSENAVFGHWTPCAAFDATIMNQAVIDKLVPGKKYYVTFVEAPD